MDAPLPAAWRRLVVAPPLVVPAAAVLLTLGGFLVDLSSLRQPADSWGYLAGALILSVMYGVAVLLVTAVLAVIGRVVDSPAPWAWLGAAVAALAGVALAGAGLAQAGQSPASAAFGVVTVVVALVLVVPLALCLRQSRTVRPG